MPFITTTSVSGCLSGKSIGLFAAPRRSSGRPSGTHRGWATAKVFAAAAQPDPTTAIAIDEPGLGLAESAPDTQLRWPLPKISSIPFGFTKSNELLFGRCALFGLAATLIAELATGQGPIALLGLNTAASSLFEVDHTILLLAGFNLVAALLPARGRFVPDKKQLPLRKGLRGAVRDATFSLATRKEFFSVHESALNKEDESNLGRFAQLGLAACWLGEAMTGKAALAHLQIDTGLPMCETEPLIIIFITFTLLAALSPGSGTYVDE